LYPQNLYARKGDWGKYEHVDRTFMEVAKDKDKDKAKAKADAC
jgi:hypothetical protein